MKIKRGVTFIFLLIGFISLAEATCDIQGVCIESPATTIINTNNTFFNSTYNNLLAQQCPAGQVVNGTLSNGTILCIAQGSGSPGGSDTNIQFNLGGTFGGTSGFTFNNATNITRLNNGQYYTSALNSIKLIQANGTEKYYPSSSNSETARGSALITALSESENGDIIVLASGNFDVANNTIVLKNNSAIIGSGIGVTRIIGNKTGALPNTGTLRLMGQNNYVGHLTINNSYYSSANPVGLPLFMFNTIKSNVVLDTIEVIGRSDAIYFEVTGADLNLYSYNTILKSNWDTIVFSPSGGAFVYADFYNLDTYVNASFYSNDARPIISDSANINLNIFGGKITSIGTINTTGGTRVANAVAVSAGNVNLFGGLKILTKNMSATQGNDLLQTGGIIGVSPDVIYNQTRVTGNLTYNSEFRDVLYRNVYAGNLCYSNGTNCVAGSSSDSPFTNNTLLTFVKPNYPQNISTNGTVFAMGGYFGDGFNSFSIGFSNATAPISPTSISRIGNNQSRPIVDAAILFLNGVFNRGGTAPVLLYLKSQINPSGSDSAGAFWGLKIDMNDADNISRQPRTNYGLEIPFVFNGDLLNQSVNKEYVGIHTHNTLPTGISGNSNNVTAIALQSLGYTTAVSTGGIYNLYGLKFDNSIGALINIGGVINYSIIDIDSGTKPTTISGTTNRWFINSRVDSPSIFAGNLTVPNLFANNVCYSNGTNCQASGSSSTNITAVQEIISNFSCPQNNGEWTCLQEEFLGDNSGTSGGFQTGWTATTQGGASVTQASGESLHYGIRRLSTSTTNSAIGNITYRKGTGDLVLSGNSTLTMLIKVTNGGSGEQVIYRFGFFDGNNADANDGAYFEINETLIVMAKTAKGGSRTINTTNYSITDNTWRKYDIIDNRNFSTSASLPNGMLFYVNNTLVTNISSNLPTNTGGGTGFGAQVLKSFVALETNGGNIYMDKWYWKAYNGGTGQAWV